MKNVTVEDVRTIAGCTFENGAAYKYQGDQITEDNYKLVMYDLGVLATDGMKGFSKNARSNTSVAFFTAVRKEPISMSLDAFYPKKPEPVPSAKVPNGFQKFMNKFGFFKKAINAYESYQQYQKDLGKYETAMQPFADKEQMNIQALSKVSNSRTAMNRDDLMRESGMDISQRVNTHSISQSKDMSRQTERNPMSM